MQKNFHPDNIHNQGYDFDFLVEQCPELKVFLTEKHQKTTIDFSNPKGIKALNKALLFSYYDVKYWDFPDENLCPPIPGRVDYLHYLSDLITDEKSVKVLDIGTGATCIYPLLGAKKFNWDFVATDIDGNSLAIAQKIIQENNLENNIKLRKQIQKEHILKGILKEEDAFTFTMCNPPFYKTEKEALEANQRKTKNLKIKSQRNFSGNANELWYVGGEKAFLHTYLYESSLFPEVSIWFTSLVSNKENIKSLEKSAQKLKVSEFRKIDMNQGNKLTRIACWKF